MKATEQYFPVVLFTMLYKVVLTFLSLWIKSQTVTIQIKATQQQLRVSDEKLSPYLSHSQCSYG